MFRYFAETMIGARVRIASSVLFEQYAILQTNTFGLRPFSVPGDPSPVGWFAGIAYCSNSTLEALRTRAPIIASAKYLNI